MDNINILYASDDKFSHVLGTSLYSLLDNNLQYKLSIYIISQGISEENKRRLYEIANSFSKNLEIIEQPDLEKIIGKKIDIQRYSLSMFSRLIADSLLDKKVTRLLYLDCDTIIKNEVKSLFEYDLNGKTFGAIDDMRNYRYSRNLGMKKESHYINSGVLVIDLCRYRQLQWQKRMIEGIEKYNSYLEFPDNDLICMLMEDEIELLPPKYNVISSMYMGDYKRCVKMRRPHRYYSKELFDIAKKNPVVIHYTTCFAFVGRPWLKGCTHPMRKSFDQYYEKTPWKEEEYKEVQNQSLGTVRKLYEKLPDNLSTFMIWFLHSWLKPNMQFFTKKRYSDLFRRNK